MCVDRTRILVVVVDVFFIFCFTLTLVQCAPLSCFDFEPAQSMALICSFVMAFDCTGSAEQDSVSSANAQSHAARRQFVEVHCLVIVYSAHLAIMLGKACVCTCEGGFRRKIWVFQF